MAMTREAFNAAQELGHKQLSVMQTATQSRLTLGDCHAKKANRPGAEYGDVHASLELGELGYRVNGDRERLDERTVLEGHRVRDLVREFCGEGVVPSKGSSSEGRRRGELHIRAELGGRRVGEVQCRRF